MFASRKFSGTWSTSRDTISAPRLLESSSVAPPSWWQFAGRRLAERSLPKTERETNLDNSGWSQMERVLKAKKTLRPAHDSPTSHRKENWASTSSTLLRATRLWLKARRTTVLAGRLRVGEPPSQGSEPFTDLAHKSDMGTHQCWSVHVRPRVEEPRVLDPRSGAVRVDGTPAAPLHPQICENKAHCEAVKQVSCGCTAQTT